MTAFLKRIIILSLCIVLVGGCTPTKKEAVQNTEKDITAIFKDKPKSANEKTEYFTFHKPSTLTISQKGKHNIIFQDHDKNVYILFVNPKEKKSSELNYQSVKKHMKSDDVLKSFHVGNTFVYVYVKPIKNEEVELVVAAGGIKMSTKTTLKQMTDQAEMMAEVILSVKIKANKKG
jgi:hypothetical protein